jgi:hypothetical protein
MTHPLRKRLLSHRKAVISAARVVQLFLRFGPKLNNKPVLFSMAYLIGATKSPNPKVFFPSLLGVRGSSIHAYKLKFAVCPYS